MRTLNCLRCGEEMKVIKREYLQMGKTGWIIGDWGNLLAGGLDVLIVACPRCGKLEFFSGGNQGEEAPGSGIAMVNCPQCGREHEMDDPKCPFCGARNTQVY